MFLKKQYNGVKVHHDRSANALHELH